MKQIPIDWPDLEEAFENIFPEISHYLDVETGEVLTVMNETLRELEALSEEYYNAGLPSRMPG